MKTRGPIAALLLVLCANGAAANDRLPKQLREGYGVALDEVQSYTRYILRKVWVPVIGELASEPLPKELRAARAAELVDEIVHLTLPQAKRITRDVLFGTGTTHVRIARPDLRAKALAAVGSLFKDGKPTSVTEAVEQAGNVAQRDLVDRIDQALREDLESYTQEWVEGAAGLPLQGRPRGFMRPLPGKWEKPYQSEARQKAHWFTYWHLRKKQRLSLAHMASAMSREEIDRARNEGPMWRHVSGISADVWAQNRVRMDFKWGRLNWEIDRRRIRRRMDQDVAQATWTMTRFVKELTSDETMKEATEQLEKRVREELSKEPNKSEGERYPDSRGSLQQRLQGLKSELDPLFNRAMDKVPLPSDMGPELSETAKEHGRRFMHEELEGRLGRAIRDEASAQSAARRVKDGVPSWVGEALARIDPGRGAKATRDAIKREALPRAREEIGNTLRAGGRDELEWDGKARERAIDDVVKRFGVEESIEREAEKQSRGDEGVRQ